ncbi:hypothetical protein HMPREF1992_02015 [Selenomonas sp. oral taxon 892 str. F0426]|nr:hypothetical protein HMPREF1992_02015 [Selenomonas sp. oral taxon 892 str. F0426]
MMISSSILCDLFYGVEYSREARTGGRMTGDILKKDTFLL